ncbi:MAG TPA: replication-relaxation family protein [Magnetospirillaceae bacterium]|nr:replication-relaxation family protein [Magnetospirillaceae bacterium]
MKLPKLTPRQQTVLILLYKYRFLNRIQIQTLMGHKDYRRINAWLADLRDNHFVEWIYSTDFLEKSKPGVYYLGLNGIRWLKEHQDHPIEEFRKRYRESSRSQGFIDQCVLVADCCIAMDKKAAESSTTGKNKVHYSYVTQADYADPDDSYHFLSESELIRPQLCYEKTTTTKDDAIAATYLLEVIEPTMPRYRVRKRLKNYIEYLEEGEWQSETDEDEPNPIAMFVCPTLTDMIYCKRATKRLLEEKEGEDIRLWFTTTEKVKALSVTGKIWEEVKAPEYDDQDEEDDED